MSLSITTSEILEALRAAHGRHVSPTDAFTTKEIAAAMGWKMEPTIRHLLDLKREGRLASVRVRREALDGRMSSVPAYRFVKPPVTPTVKPKGAIGAKGAR